MNAVHSNKLTVRFSCYSRELHNILYIGEVIPKNIWLEVRVGGSRRYYTSRQWVKFGSIQKATSAYTLSSEAWETRQFFKSFQINLRVSHRRHHLCICEYEKSFVFSIVTYVHTKLDIMQYSTIVFPTLI